MDEESSRTLTFYADIPNKQYSLDGIAIYSTRPPGFDITGYSNLNPDELKDWLNKPYIVAKAWSDIEAAFDADKALLKNDCAGNCASRQEQMERARRMARKDWFNTYPYGIRYEIRCLDGRSPGRTTVWGTEATFIAAILRAKAGPAWM